MNKSGDRASEVSEMLRGLNIEYIGLDLLGSNIRKQQEGSDYRGKCPFHEGKSRSFYLRLEKNRFICYSCRANGGPIALTFKLKDKEEAKRYLLERIGVPTDDADQFDKVFNYLLDLEIVQP